MADGALWLDDLKAAVALTTDVEQSAAVFMDGLAAKLEAVPVGADPNIMAGIIAELRQQGAALGAAILRNTPAAPEPPPAPAGDPADPAAGGSQ